jgi:hypothetical protein
VARHHTWPKGFHNGVNVLRLDTVDDKIAAARDEVAVLHDLNVWLTRSQYVLFIGYGIYGLSYKVPEVLHQAIVFLRKIAGIDSECAASAHVRDVKDL